MIGSKEMFDKLNINVNQECSHQVSGGGGVGGVGS